MPDPKLKTAAEEIKAVLKKHDIGAVVVLGSQSHTEFLIEIAPTWSCAWMEGNFLRIRSQRSEYPSLEAQKKKLEDTVGLVMGFIDASRRNIESLEAVVALIGQKMDVSHWSRRDDLP